MKERIKNHMPGFTIVELMVTIVLAILILGGIYVIFSRSVGAYRVENQILSMQDRARFGLDHIRRDLRRAGFLATPNSIVDANVCPKPDAALRAVSLYPNTGTVFQPWGDANPNIEPTSIVLFGDFFSGQIYRTQGVIGNRVFLQVTANFPPSEAEFNRVFNTDRYLRIVTKDQYEIMVPIQESDFVERSVTLEEEVPVVGATAVCGISGFGEGLDVNVAGFIRYRIAADTRPNAPVGKTDLVREELQVDGLNVIDGSQLVIADYAVDLQFYDFGFDTDNTGLNPTVVVFPLLSNVAGSGVGFLDPQPGSTPEDLRFLTAVLTVRSEEEDPNHTYLDRAEVFAPLDGYQLDEMDGGCRTLTTASRVQLSSVAVRNLKGVAP